MPAKYLEMDARLAEWEPKLMDILSKSRDAVAHSRHLLGNMNDRNGT